MHVDTDVLYVLAKQIKDIQRAQLESVLNTYLLSNQNVRLGLELDQVKNIQSVIFSKISPSSVAKQEERPDEINKNLQSPKPK